jgi:hypothetical protein
MLLHFVSQAYSVESTLAWDPNVETDIGGYKLYYGTSSRNYQFSVDVGNQTSYTVTGLLPGQTYFFAATAYDISGNESDFSNEVAYQVSHEFIDVDTHQMGEFTLSLSKQAIDGFGRFYISLEATNVQEWKNLVWFRPRDDNGPTQLVLVKDVHGFFPNADGSYFYEGPLSSNAGGFVFVIGNLQDLTGRRVIFKSWYLEAGLPFSSENLILVDSVAVTFH